MDGDLNAQNIDFVMNVSRLVGASAFELAPGHVLRQASVAETKDIQRVIESQLPPFPRVPVWECRRANTGQYEALPEIEWRYFVVAFNGPNLTMTQLEGAFQLAPVE